MSAPTVGASANVGTVRAVVVKIDSVVDYTTVDLVQRAIEEVENRDGAIMIIELNANGGYLQPTVEIIQRLTSASLKIVVYVGPRGASALSYPTLLAMVGNVLVMNDGTSIGAAGLTDPSSMNHMMNMMRSLAKTNGRDAVAAENMIINDTVYSADEALAKGICDRKVDDYNNLLTMLNVDPSNVMTVERKAVGVDLPNGAALVRLIANHTFVELMFIALTLLVSINIIAALRRHGKVNDEPHQALINLLRMEIQSLEAQKYGKEHTLPDIPLHTSLDIQPPTTINRIPTPQARMLQKPIEVNEN
jgi:membrane-bound ClpP family serine protease